MGSEMCIRDRLAPGWQNVLPWEYAHIADPKLLASSLIAVAGVFLVLVVEKIAKND